MATNFKWISMDIREINIIVMNDHFEDNKHLIPLLFEDWDIIHYVNTDINMYDILVKYEFFSSNGDCKRKWNKTGRDIPNGYTDIIQIGKFNRNLTIWNPVSLKDE
ncbi:MAG: hypothetical protein ACXAC2_03720 [Candidatus Kariarchaeaceae archaeon]|jgi:hypothetical protein